MTVYLAYVGSGLLAVCATAEKAKLECGAYVGLNFFHLHTRVTWREVANGWAGVVSTDTISVFLQCSIQASKVLE